MAERAGTENASTVDSPGSDSPGPATPGAGVTDSMAYAFHTLSSYGWFDEPPQQADATVLGDLPGRDGALAGSEAGALVRLLRARTSRRSFTGGPLDTDTLRLLLWCGYGRTAAAPVAQHTVPSAGGTYPLRLVTVGLRTDPGATGVREFDPASGALTALPGPGLDSGALAALFRTRHVRFDAAAAVVFLTARWEPPMQRYGERGYRYLLLEAGHAAQNLCLAATALGVGQVPLGGFDDDATLAALTTHGVPAAPVYAVALGATGRDLPDAAELLRRAVAED